MRLSCLQNIFYTLRCTFYAEWLLLLDLISKIFSLLFYEANFVEYFMSETGILKLVDSVPRLATIVI